MGRIKLNATIIYRVPQFSYGAEFKQCWEALKLSIQETASNDFYRVIADCAAEDVAGLPENVRHTIWKYFNRARFRATPYGSFAGLGLIRTGNKPAAPAIISSIQTGMSFPDWECIEQVSASFAELVERDAWLFSNHTYYIIGAHIRYVCRGQDGYELADLPCDNEVVNMLRFCQKPQLISRILDALREACQNRRCLEVIESMYADQLLFSSEQPNIIGKDYFTRIGAVTHANQPQYIISERPLKSGHIDRDIFKSVPALIERLHQLLPSYKSRELERFTTLFLDKFGEAEVPIMVALDPEGGVGYGEMEQDLLSSDLIQKLAAKRDETSVSNTSTLDLLLPAMAGSPKSVIQLEEMGLPANLHNDPLPNSIPVLLTYGAGMLQLEHAGGATANSLLGRFTLANETILDHCQSIATMEQNANPDILFFDIGYMTGKRIDNVNRRKAIYDFQLAILNYDTSQSPLALNDLFISVRQSQVILRSRNLGKRLIPRLATAYNYLLSDLPVFRFLCDLQHQGTHKNLSLRLRDRLPELSFYPRLQYSNIVLSPATWLLQWDEIKSATAETDSYSLGEYLLQKAMPRFVKVGHGDQTLCIDTSCDDDLAALLIILKKQKSIHLEEMLIDEDTILQDELGAPYAPQFMLTLYHQDKIYEDLPHYGYTAGIHETAVILPAGEWLYFEIFCHPVRTNQLLTIEINNLLQKYQDRIKNWFFIRYTKNGAHIRLRIQLFNSVDGHTVSVALMPLLQEKVNAGIISDIAIKPYRREISRYGQDHIAAVESHFQKDSEYVLSLLEQDFSDHQKYQLSLALIDAINNAAIINTASLHQLLKANSENYIAEHSLGPKEFKLLNRESDQIITDIPLFLTDHIITLLQQFTSSFITLLNSYPENERTGIFSSIFHMHINRLFPTSQRVHETTIYYFAQKVMNRKAALAKAVFWPQLHS